jgi:hypothetical protein
LRNTGIVWRWYDKEHLTEANSDSPPRQVRDKLQIRHDFARRKQHQMGTAGGLDHSLTAAAQHLLSICMTSRMAHCAT